MDRNEYSKKVFERAANRSYRSSVATLGIRDVGIAIDVLLEEIERLEQRVAELEKPHALSCDLDEDCTCEKNK